MTSQRLQLVATPSWVGAGAGVPEGVVDVDEDELALLETGVEVGVAVVLMLEDEETGSG